MIKKLQLFIRLQTHKLEALHELKSGKISILLETVDIPTADLVINYDFPRLLFFFIISILLVHSLLKHLMKWISTIHLQVYTRLYPPCRSYCEKNNSETRGFYVFPGQFHLNRKQIEN